MSESIEPYRGTRSHIHGGDNGDYEVLNGPFSQDQRSVLDRIIRDIVREELALVGLFRRTRVRPVDSDYRVGARTSTGTHTDDGVGEL